MREGEEEKEEGGWEKGSKIRTERLRLRINR